MDGTTRYLLRIIRRMPDASIAEIAAESGVPARIVQKVLAEVARSRKPRKQ